MQKLMCAVLLGLAWGASADDQGAQGSLDAAITEFSHYIDEQTAKDEFSGTVLVAKGDKILYSAARGMASKRYSVANNLQTKINLGSMNKMFTATAIMQLVEQGKIRLDDKLSRYLDDSWLPRKISSRIEIQHLLTHASGLGTYFTDEFYASSKTRFRNLKDFKPLTVNSRLSITPGSDFSYSNVGMLLLGAVIEKASGQDYYRYIDEHIYAPAGMINSGCYEMDQPVPNLAIGYLRDRKSATGWRNNLYLHVIRGGPAGGCFSTAEDLYHFAMAFTAFKLVNRENTELLYSTKPQFHHAPYGFGFQSGGKPQNRVVGHSGGFDGISSNLDIFLDGGYIAVVLSNYDGASVPVVVKLRQLLKPGLSS